MGTVRLFVAVWLPDEVAAELELLPRKDRPGVRFVPAENWHITLAFLGEASPRAVVEALDGADLPGASVTLGPIVELLGDHSLIVRADGLDELAARVGKAVAGLGSATPRRRYLGHVTLARRHRSVRERRDPLVGFPIHARFDVERVALVQSRLGRDGAHYEELHSWPTNRA